MVHRELQYYSSSRREWLPVSVIHPDHLYNAIHKVTRERNVDEVFRVVELRIVEDKD